MCPIKALIGRDPKMIGDWIECGDSVLGKEEEIKDEALIEEAIEARQQNLKEMTMQLMVKYKAFQKRMCKKYIKRRKMDYEPKIGDEVLCKEITKQRIFAEKEKYLPKRTTKNKYVLVKCVDENFRVTLQDVNGNISKQKYKWDQIIPYRQTNVKQQQEEVDTQSDLKSMLDTAKTKETEFIEVAYNKTFTQTMRFWMIF